MSHLPGHAGLPALPGLPGLSNDVDTDTESPSPSSLSQRSRDRSAPSSPSRDPPHSPPSPSSPPSASSPTPPSDEEGEGEPSHTLSPHPPLHAPSTAPTPLLPPASSPPSRSPSSTAPPSSSSSSSTSPAPPHYLWRIEHFLHLRSTHTERYYSPEFSLDGQQWKMLLFPCGNRQVVLPYHTDALALYIQLAQRLDHPILYQHHFSFTAIPPQHPPTSPFAHISAFTKDSTHRFTNEDNDRGFNPWLEAKELPAYLHPPHGTLLVKVEIVKQKLAPLAWTDPLYDSKTATGFVGLRNQGATCFFALTIGTCVSLTAPCS